MTRHGYRISGLAVSSDVALPGAVERPVDAPDVLIRCGPVPAELADAHARGPTWQLGTNRMLLRVPGVACFLLSHGREIDVEMENALPPQEAAPFLVGTVFGMLLHLRGQIVLHASAVDVGGRAVLFCGGSGAGKSTLAAVLDQAGYPVVADDFCAIGFGSDGPVALPDGRQLKLWDHSIRQLALTASRGVAVRECLEKFFVQPRHSSTDGLPVGAVYALREARPSQPTGISRPNLVDAGLLLRVNAYRPLLVKRMGQKSEYFQAATAIAAQAGIFHLTRALDFAELPAVTAALEAHWRELGLLPRTP